MRLFLGIEISDEVKRSIDQSMKPMRMNLKGWEDPDDYHLTLLFIGPATSENFEEIKRRLRTIKFDRFTVQSSSLEFFSRRILYLSLEPSDSLIRLRHQVADLFPEWSRDETKQFIPHLTIKRWQRYEYDDLKSKIGIYPVQRFKICVDHVALFISEKRFGNKKYHVLDRSELQ